MGLAETLKMRQKNLPKGRLPAAKFSLVHAVNRRMFPFYCTDGCRPKNKWARWTSEEGI